MFLTLFWKLIGLNNGLFILQKIKYDIEEEFAKDLLLFESTLQFLFKFITKFIKMILMV